MERQSPSALAATDHMPEADALNAILVRFTALSCPRSAAVSHRGQRAHKGKAAPADCAGLSEAAPRCLSVTNRQQDGPGGLDQLLLHGLAESP